MFRSTCVPRIGRRDYCSKQSQYLCRDLIIWQRSSSREHLSEKKYMSSMWWLSGERDTSMFHLKITCETVRRWHPWSRSGKRPSTRLQKGSSSTLVMPLVEYLAPGRSICNSPMQGWNKIPSSHSNGLFEKNKQTNKHHLCASVKFRY